MKLKFTFILLFVQLVNTSFAQIFPTYGNNKTGGSGMQFLKITPDAKSAAMSGAVVGLVNDASAMFWNPAGITSIDTGKVMIVSGINPAKGLSAIHSLLCFDDSQNTFPPI